MGNESPERHAELSREADQLEAEGRSMAAHSDDWLVGHVMTRGNQPWSQNVALAELQRRLAVAIRDSAAQAERQAEETNRLNTRVVALTVAILILTFVQACSSLWPLLAGRRS